MAKNVYSATRWQGIADFPKESLIPDQYAWSRSVDYRTDPRKITLLPKTTKESGNVVIDLPKWGEEIPTSLTSYFYGESGNIYSRDSSVQYVNLHTVPDSTGNGMAYFGEDQFLYYTSDTTIGRYGPLSIASPQFYDDFLGAQGGVPTNTNSLILVAASSQYAARADTASLSITGNICLEADVKFTTLPAVGSSMTLVSKWDESGATRSYKMDVAAISGYFGDGSDTALTISTNTTQAPTDSACTGTVGTYTLSATNASFAAGQVILIHQSQGVNAGTWQRTKILTYTAGTITTTDLLNATYTTGAQVLVLKQYTNVTVNAGITWTAKAWNGTTGGILAFLASGTTTINGSIRANGVDAVTTTPGTGIGFNGGQSDFTDGQSGTQGDGKTGAGGLSTAANANGGGGGYESSVGGPNPVAGGGGGGNGAIGGTGSKSNSSSIGGVGGDTAGAADLTTMVFGGGGGGGAEVTGANGGAGGAGGGIVFISSATFVMGGSSDIRANGGAGGEGTGVGGGGGGGAGGSILIKAQTATFGTSLVTASGGSAGSGGGDGGAGRIHLDYLTSYTGTTTPTLNATQDNSLVTTTSYQARLGISSDGTAFENLSKVINIQTGLWYRISISWVASTSTATFYLNASSVGTTVGTLTAIHDNASTFAVGSNKDSGGTYVNFLNGLIDDVRVWNTTRSASQIFSFDTMQLQGTEAGLAAYYLLNGAYTDLTANANNLTASGSPAFSTDVPWAGATTRLDIDQTPSPVPSGQTYTTLTAISESAVNRLTFTPGKDPQKSLDVLVAAKGTGDVTVTVHDVQNNVIATKTLATASMFVGYVEFIFSTPWRPTLGRAYHFHVTSTVADTTLTTTNLNDLETVAYHTYFSFLVSDSNFHPIKTMLNFLAIGNERYVATWDGINYLPNRIVLPSGFRVRSFAYWREFLAIGVWKGTNVYDFDEGRIYFWDGISTTFNFFIDVPEGAVNAMFGTKGELYIWAGYLGDMLLYVGGDKAEKIKRLPKITRDKYVDIYPGAVTMYRTLVHYGIAGVTNSAVIEKGVYSWGSVNNKYVDSLSYDYPISTGNRTATNIRLGMVMVVGQKLLIGWQDNVGYGIDAVDPTGAPFASGTVEMLIRDEDAIWRDQMALILRLDTFPLVSGESVDIKYQLDQSGTWTGLDTPMVTVGAKGANLNINSGRSREYQIAFDLFTTVSTSPTVIGISLMQDRLEEEEQFPIGNANI